MEKLPDIIQHCPTCKKYYRHGQWVTWQQLGRLIQVKMVLACQKGELEIAEGDCQDCRDKGLASLGHA